MLCTLATLNADEDFSFAVTKSTPYAQSVQIFQGKKNHEPLKVMMLKIGTKEKQAVLVKFMGEFEHEWLGKIFLCQIEEKKSYGSISRIEYWTLPYEDRFHAILSKKNPFNSTRSHHVYLPGLRDSISVHFSKDLSQKISAEDFFHEYLSSTNQQVEIKFANDNKENNAQEIDKLKKQISEMHKKNMQVKHFEKQILQLKNKILKQKVEIKKLKQMTIELESKNRRLSTQLQQTKQQSADHDINFNDYLRFYTDSYYLDGTRFQYYNLEFMVNNYQKQKESITNIEISFWIDQKWEAGQTLKSKFRLPQQLQAMSPNNVYAVTQIQSDEHLVPVTIKVEIHLFSGTKITTELEINQKRFSPKLQEIHSHVNKK